MAILASKSKLYMITKTSRLACYGINSEVSTIGKTGISYTPVKKYDLLYMIKENEVLYLSKLNDKNEPEKLCFDKNNMLSK